MVKFELVITLSPDKQETEVLTESDVYHITHALRFVHSDEDLPKDYSDELLKKWMVYEGLLEGHSPEETQRFEEEQQRMVRHTRDVESETPDLIDDDSKEV